MFHRFLFIISHAYFIPENIEWITKYVLISAIAGKDTVYKNLSKKKTTRPPMDATAEIIQKRIVICDSGQPNASKWW